MIQNKVCVLAGCLVCTRRLIHLSLLVCYQLVYLLVCVALKLINNFLCSFWVSGEIEKMSKKMEEVRDAGVRVVAEDFLTDIKESGKALQELISLHAISPWGAEVKVESQAAAPASKSTGAHSSKSTGRVKEEEGKKDAFQLSCKSSYKERFKHVTPVCTCTRWHFNYLGFTDSETQSGSDFERDLFG